MFTSASQLTSPALNGASDGPCVGPHSVNGVPYKAQVALTIALVVPIFALELAPAWIVKTGLDLVLGQGAAAEGAKPDPLAWILEAPAWIGPMLWLAVLYLVVTLLLAGLQFVPRRLFRGALLGLS